MSDIKLNIPGLNGFIKALESPMPEIRVGILSDKARKGSKVTNATVGFMHEFGTSTLPRRSFLRIPLMDNLGDRLEESGAFDDATLEEVIASEDIVPWATKIAIIAEGIVLEAFDTGGFGKWKPSDMSKKKVHQTLVETGQLKKSISWEVK